MSFCTYFNDGLYLTKASVCIYTLLQQDPSAKMYALCFDKAAFNKISALKSDRVVPILMDVFEKKFPQLPSIANTRTRKEYFVTTKPFLPEYIFQEYGEDKTVFVDADMAFWGNPDEVFDVYKNYSLLVTDHELNPIPRAGRFNVGLVGFRNDDKCNEFLRWWQKKCIQWCKWDVGPNGAFAEQGYLNILHNQPSKFSGVLSCPQPGINLGPWNIAKHKVSKKDGKLVVDGKHNLITYHYHEFQMTGLDTFHPTGWKVTVNDIELLYKPYVKLFKKARDEKLWG